MSPQVPVQRITLLAPGSESAVSISKVASGGQAPESSTASALRATRRSKEESRPSGQAARVTPASPFAAQLAFLNEMEAAAEEEEAVEEEEEARAIAEAEAAAGAARKRRDAALAKVAEIQEKSKGTHTVTPYLPLPYLSAQHTRRKCAGCRTRCM